MTLGTGIRSARQTAQMRATTQIRDAMVNLTMLARTDERMGEFRSVVADIASGLLALKAAGVEVPDLNPQPIGAVE